MSFLVVCVYVYGCCKVIILGSRKVVVLGINWCVLFCVLSEFRMGFGVMSVVHFSVRLV